MYPMRRAAILLVLAMVGCTSLFGLDVPPNVDRDNDNHRDVEDNCPRDPNQDQSDFDRDGAGDACDECVDGGGDDLDADGIPDGCDGCVGNGSDEDGDGIPDNCDGCLESGDDGDGDGIDDACDACIGKGQDIDGDQVDDACDECINTYVDMDVDGIDDGCDTCIAGGIDGDADGVDDQCDPCTAGPQHDEDGDLLFDACDNCPAVDNPDQANITEVFGPSDVLGDACDDDSALNTEIFEPFTKANPSWFVQGANWLLDIDVMRYLGGAESYRLLGSAQDVFTVRARVTANSPSIGLQVRWVTVFASIGQLQPAFNRIECYVDLTTGASSIRSYGATTEIVAGPTIDFSMPFVLTLRVDEANKTAQCVTDGNKAGPSLIPQVTGPWIPGVAASRSAVSFHYFDVVTR